MSTKVQPFRKYMCFHFYLLFHSFSVSVGREMMFCAEGCTAVIDTGSSYITGPASSVSVLMKTIGAQLDESGVSFYTRNTVSHKKACLQKFMSCHQLLLCVVRQYKVNCDTVKTLPSVTFHLGGQEYSLTQEDYILWVRVLMDAQPY